MTSKWITQLAVALLVVCPTVSMAGAPAPYTVHTASISLKLDTQDTSGGKILNGTLTTRGLINLLLGVPVDDKVDSKMKLVVIIPCNPNGDLAPMFVTVWDTQLGGYVNGADWLEFDSDFTLVELDKNENLKKASVYAWQSGDGIFATFDEMDAAFSATFRQLPKNFESSSVCVNTLKASAVTGEIIEDQQFGQNWVIKGGKLSASKPIAVIPTFPPVL